MLTVFLFSLLVLPSVAASPNAAAAGLAVAAVRLLRAFPVVVVGQPPKEYAEHAAKQHHSAEHTEVCSFPSLFIMFNLCGNRRRPVSRNPSSRGGRGGLAIFFPPQGVSSSCTVTPSARRGSHSKTQRISGRGEAQPSCEKRNLGLVTARLAQNRGVRQIAPRWDIPSPSLFHEIVFGYGFSSKMGAVGGLVSLGGSSRIIGGEWISCDSTVADVSCLFPGDL